MSIPPPKTTTNAGPGAIPEHHPVTHARSFAALDEITFGAPLTFANDNVQTLTDINQKFIAIALQSIAASDPQKYKTADPVAALVSGPVIVSVNEDVQPFDEVRIDPAGPNFTKTPQPGKTIHLITAQYITKRDQNGNAAIQLASEPHRTKIDQ